MEVEYKGRQYRLPDFLIIGLGKCGTTTLADYLGMHPEVGMSAIKEPHFFSYDFVFKRGIPWYATLFNQCRGARVLGEASTSYSRIHQHPAVLQRIHDVLPKSKIIMMVRNPLDRIVSAYIEWLATPDHEQTYGSINEALLGMPTFIEASRYWTIYSVYARQFGAKNVHIVWFDDLLGQQNRVFEVVCKFLGVNEFLPPEAESIQSNARMEVEQRAREFGRETDAVNLNWTTQSRELLYTELEGEISTFLQHFNRSELWQDFFSVPEA